MQKPSKILADIETEFGDCVSAGYGCRRRFEAALERAFEAGREYERSPRENAEVPSACPHEWSVRGGGPIRCGLCWKLRRDL